MARKPFRRSLATIGEAVRKVEDLLRRDKSLEQSIKRMRENLVKGTKRKYRLSVT